MLSMIFSKYRQVFNYCAKCILASAFFFFFYVACCVYCGSKYLLGLF